MCDYQGCRRKVKVERYQFWEGRCLITEFDFCLPHALRAAKLHTARNKERKKEFGQPYWYMRVES